MADIHDLAVGQIVFSKSGRDKGMAFIIVAVKGDYLYLADGKLRKIEKPKCKKRMHIQPVKYIDVEMRRKLTEWDGDCPNTIKDADIRKALSEFRTTVPNE